MAFTLPWPNRPSTNENPASSQPIRENFNSIAQAIQAFDGSQIQAATVADTALATTNSVIITRRNAFANYIITGLTLPILANLSSTLAAGTAIINGKQVTISSQSVTVTASKDTYIYLKDDGSVITTNNVTNNTTSPAATTNTDGSTALLLCIVIASGSAITTVNQGDPTAVLPIVSSIAYSVCDGIGNLIHPTSPTPGLIGYRQIISNFTTTVVATNTDVTGLSVPVIIPSGRKIRINSWANRIASSQAAGNAVYNQIFEGGTALAAGVATTPAVSYNTHVTASVITLPSTGLHTYKVQTAQDAAGTLTFYAGASNPSYISVELI